MIDNDFLTIEKLKLIFSVMANEIRIQHTSLGILKKQMMKTYSTVSYIVLCLEFYEKHKEVGFLLPLPHI